MRTTHAMRHPVWTLLGALVIHGAGVEALQAQPAGELTLEDGVPTAISYVQLYPGPDGETHFREVTVPLTLELAAPPAPPYAVSAFQSGTTIRHVAWPANWGIGDRDGGVLHNAVSARFISVRRGELWIRASDGETRRFQAGDVLEVLDVAPSKGHTTWIGDEPAAALFSNHP